MVNNRRHLPNIVFLFGIFITIGVCLQFKQIYFQSLESELRITLNSIRSNIQEVFYRKFNVTIALEAFVAANDELDLNNKADEAQFRKKFNTFAQKIKQSVPNIRSIQLAPLGVVTYVSEKQRDRAAVGHDLLVDEKRRNQVLETIASKSTMVAGPIELIQGGNALIARKAIFADRETFRLDNKNLQNRFKNSVEELTQIPSNFWGLATILISTDQFAQETGLSELPSKFEYALRGKHGLGFQGDVFWGNDKVFNLKNFATEINIPGGSWILAAKVKQSNLSIYLFFIAVFGGFVSFLIRNLFLTKIEKEYAILKSEEKSKLLSM